MTDICQKNIFCKHHFPAEYRMASAIVSIHTVKTEDSQLSLLWNSIYWKFKKKKKVMWILESNSHLIRLSALMQDPSINSSSQQIIRSRYSMNISSQMKIELDGESNRTSFYKMPLTQPFNLKKCRKNKNKQQQHCHLLEIAAQISHLSL